MDTIKPKLGVVLMKRKRKTSTSIENIRNKDGNLVSDPANVANCLNEHFSTIGKTMDSNFENTPQSDNIKDPLDYISKKVDQTITFS